MKESAYEQKICKQLRSIGYLTQKLVDMPGWPDRMIVGHRGRVVFVEFKTMEGRLSPKQMEIHAELVKRGHKVLLAREDMTATDIAVHLEN